MFHDEFDSLDLGALDSGAHIWHEGVWFHKQHAPLSNISASGSVLSLKWRSDQGSTDTSIATFSSASPRANCWRYGYFEARMKWNVIRGAWPAIWLIPVEDAEDVSNFSGHRESGEIDIFEGQGDHPHTFYGTIHDWVDLRGIANPDNHFDLPDDVDLSQFHVYGVLWTPGRIAWYLDSRLLHAEKGPAIPAILDRQHFFLVIGIQEGVNWRLGDTSGVSASEMKLAVDWVRVWQK